MAKGQNDFPPVVGGGPPRPLIDAEAKKLFTHRQVIAGILKYSVPEYGDMPLDVIARKCLQGGDECVPSLGTELILPFNDTLRLDLLFDVKYPNSSARWLLDIEIQNDCRRLDRLLSRGIVYLSGLICSEYGKFFNYPKYEQLKRVHGVWLCLASSAGRAGTVHNVRMAASASPEGGRLPPEETTDRMRLTLVHNCGDMRRGAKDVHGFLWALTAQGLEMSERERILTEVYGMTMTETVKQAIDDSERLWQNFYGRKRWKRDLKESEKRGLQEGKKLGLLEGEKRGLQEGEKRGLQEGREEVVVMMLKRNYDLAAIEDIAHVSRERILQLAEENLLLVNMK